MTARRDPIRARWPRGPARTWFHARMKNVLPVSLLLPFFSGGAGAACLDARPTVRGEFGAADAVVVATAVAQHTVRDPGDAEGILATIYVVRIAESFSGDTSRAPIHVWSDNDSSRYLLDPGEEHLLFLSTGDDGFWRGRKLRKFQAGQRKWCQT